MKVCLCSPGRFHGFDLAAQVARLGHLARLYTGYPVWKVDGVPRELVSSFPWLIGPMMLLNRHNHEMAARLKWLASELFDCWAMHALERCDVLHFSAGSGLRTLRGAKRRYAAVTVCDRGSTHILEQEALVAEEYDRWGVPRRPVSRRIVDKQLQEYQEADVIVVPSTFVYNSFVRHGVPCDKIAKVPYGVDLRVFRPIPKTDNVFRVIYVGVISFGKGIPYMLEALAPLRLKDFEIWLVGPVQQETRRFIETYRDSIKLFGFVPRNELYRYYSQASVFVIASIDDGLPTVMAQAMACGLPVVATDRTGAEDLFTDGVEGFIVPARSPEAIREKVIHLYEHPQEREEMALAALRRVRALRGWNHYGEQMVSVYRHALSLT